jgi:predicted transcriptional regulator
VADRQTLMETDRSRRFLNAFHAIEAHLKKLSSRSRAGGSPRDTFYGLVDSAKGDAAVYRFQFDLKEYADLRNAIVHERKGGLPIAEPHPDTVEAIEGILRQLVAPPKLVTKFRKKVQTCRPEDPIRIPARVMRDHNFSQMPVYGEEFLALLTSETIARWIGVAVGEDDIVIGATVAQVLREAEDTDNFVLLSADSTIFDAKEQFDDYQNRGKYLDAIVITQNGRRLEQPLGIVTIFDYPQLLGA